MTEPQTKQGTFGWEPPTPNSSQIGFHSPKLPVDHLVLLPPPLVPTGHHDARRRSTSTESHSDPIHPSLLVPPLRLPEASLSSPPLPKSHERVPPESPRGDPRGTATSTSPTTHWEVEYTQRPRRTAAIVAESRIPRQPSPLELDSDDATFSPPHATVTSTVSSSGKSTTESSGGKGGGASKRKVSHSLIERRRREKINDCLATLKETVPSLREEGAKKIAKAKERGKKRGREDDASERGGLHKLEILQGAIEYINELRSQLNQFRPTSLRQTSPHTTRVASPAHALCEDTPTPPASGESSTPLAVNSIESEPTTEPASASPADLSARSATTMSREEADHAASMLLYFSTSPELRPVRM